MNIKRCSWAKTTPEYIAYHDEEWGVPVHDDRKLFEFLVLEGAQAGLSWSTILGKRANYKRAFDGFDPSKVSRYTKKKIQSLLQDTGLVRNRLKICSAISNAQHFLSIQAEYGSFDQYLWSFVNHRPIQNQWHHSSLIPTRTDLSDALSKDLRRRGFKFVGSTICYAYMQAIGMINDHTAECFRHREIQDMA